MFTLAKNPIYKANIILNNEIIGNYSIQSIEFTKDFYYWLIDEVMTNINEYSKKENFNIINFLKHNNINIESEFIGKRILFIDEFKIKEEFQSKGIGSKTLNVISNLARCTNIDYLILHPYPIGYFEKEEFEEKYDKLICFYKKNGFDIVDDSIEYFYMYKDMKGVNNS